jgi:hypothetical protein
MKIGRFEIKLSDTAKAPEGDKVELKEHGVSGKDSRSQFYKAHQSWLGQFDPAQVSLETIKKMQTHPVISLGTQIISAPLINAKWDVACGDPDRKAFVKAVLDPIYTEMMLYALTSIEFGFSVFTKQWAVEVPFDQEGKEAWKGGIEPVIIKKLKQLDPMTVAPIVMMDEFKGVYQTGYGQIDPMYAVWVTHAKHKVFGNLWGWPLLVNVYKLWWSSMFRYGLRDRHIEDRVVPPLMVRHPPGTYEDETGAKKLYRDAALEVGKALRSGETVAMSSERMGEDEQSPSNTFKWDAGYLQGGENLDAFIKLDDADDMRILMGMLIPPGAVLNPKGGLGSQAVAESLGRLFWDTEVIRILELDRQLTKYVVQPLIDLNFGPGPQAKLIPTGFLKSDRELVSNILRIIANRQDIDPSRVFDIQEMASQLDIPTVKSAGPIIKTPMGITQEPDWVKEMNKASLESY